MKRAILLHGTMADSNSNWLQWLKSELEAKQFEVWVPDLPNADYPSLIEWTDFILDNCPFEIDEQTTLIGHSSGSVAVLVLAQGFTRKIHQIISVGVYKDLEYLQEVVKFHANDRFFDIPFNFEKLKQNCDNIVFIHSDDDPYCPLNHAEYLSKKTGGKLVVIPGQGHFNKDKSPDYFKFPALLDQLS